ncbi:MAG: hypothetical protein WCS43_12925, partial [Verrucomicrobiota bacterium]
TETGGSAEAVGFPAESKNTNPGKCRKPPATSTGVRPASRVGRAWNRIVTSAIALVGKGRQPTEASRKPRNDRKP